MAQAGYTPISLYHTTSTGVAPTAGNLVNGELAINIADGILYYKDNVGVVKSISGATATYTRTSFTATAGQTVFTVSYNPSFVEVFLNGVLLNATDYTATNGTSITLATGAALNDIVEVIAFNVVNIGQAANLAGGIASQIPYQTGAGATAFIPNGTSGQALLSNGTSAPSWGTLSVSGGGTGTTSLTSNNVILGNGTSAVQFVAPGTNGNVLTSNGTTWTSAAAPASTLGVDVQTFNASGTWTKPAGYSANSRVLVEVWGGGGSGRYASAGNAGSGGGGGGYSFGWFSLSQLGATESVTVGAGGASQTSPATDGIDGGNSSFGSLLTGYGGGKGAGPNSGGGGGGQLSKGNASGGTFSGAPFPEEALNFGNAGEGAGGNSTKSNGTGGRFKGGGGSTGNANCEGSVYGGGGGSGTSSTGVGGTPGTSIFGGAGGGLNTAGSQPGGGGGAGYNTSSGAGGAGRVRVTIFAGV